MNKNKKANFLEFVPIINEANTYSCDAKNRVTVHMVHRGFYAFIAQKIFGRPRISNISLDRYGSFLWMKMDGKRNVGDLAECMLKQFGEDAQPLYERLVHYLKILRNNHFIRLEK